MKICPNWTYVATQNDKIQGYLTSAPNTVLFEREKKLKFAPLLFLRTTILRRFSWNIDTKTFVSEFLCLKKNIYAHFSKKLKLNLRLNYPAHLHINVDEELRGSKAGSLLINDLEVELKNNRISGVHLFCSKDPKIFYEKMGFEILESVTLDGKNDVFCFGKKF